MCKASAQTNSGPWLAELSDIESSKAKVRSVCHAYVRFVKLLPRMYTNYPDPTKLYFCCVKKKNKSFQKLNLTAFNFLFPLFFLFFFSGFLISKHLR